MRRSKKSVSFINADGSDRRSKQIPLLRKTILARLISTLLLPAMVALPSVPVWAADNLLIGSGGNGAVGGGGGGIGGGGGHGTGGGGGGIGGGGASLSYGGNGGGDTVTGSGSTLGTGIGGIGGGGGSFNGGGGGAIGGSGGNGKPDFASLYNLIGGSASQQTGVAGGDGTGTLPGAGGLAGGGGGGDGKQYPFPGGSGGGGGAVVDANGNIISGVAPSAGASGTPSMTVSSDQTYAYVGVGGGGGGGGAYGQIAATSGTAGTLHVDSGATFSVTRSLLIGGSGGGSGSSLNNPAGNGGAGSVTLDHATLSVAETILVGGSGGGGNSNNTADLGGSGAAGSLDMDHSTLSSTHLLVGGNGGYAGPWGGSAGEAAAGTVNLTDSNATMSGDVAVGGVGGAAGMVNGSLLGKGGDGGDGTLTLERTAMSIAGNMRIGNTGGDGNAWVINSRQGASGVGGSGTATIGASTLSVAGNLYIGGNGGNGKENGRATQSIHRAGIGGEGQLNLDQSTLNVSGDVLIGGNGGDGGFWYTVNTSGSMGGNGADGVLTSTNSTINMQGGKFVLGGQAGTVAQPTAPAGAAGHGTLNLSGGSMNFSNGASFAINAGSTLNIGNATVNDAAGGAITGLASMRNDGSINFNQSDASYTFTAGMSGSGSVAQNSSGTTIVTGDLTHSGGTTINDGKLQIGNGGTTGSINGNISNNAALSFNRQGSTSYSGVISGSGSLSQDGSGTTILTGNNTYTGTTTVTAGTLQLGDGGTSGSVLGDISNNGTVAFNRSDSFVYSNIISGSGALDKQGTGTLTVTNTQAYTGGTRISGGTLQIGNGGTTGSITGDIESNAALVFARSDAITYSDVISGSGSLDKQGSGTLTLNAANTYTGGTTISAGTLTLGASGSLAASGAVTLAAGTSLDFSAAQHQTVSALNSAAASNVLMGSNNLTVSGNANSSFNGDISGSGALVKDGSGTLTLGAAQNYTGGTTINGGTLSLVADGAFANGRAVSMSGTGALDISGANGDRSIGALSGTGGRIALGNLTLAVNQSTDTTFAGAISGAGGITKQGTGELTLTGANSISGMLEVSGGGALNISNGGTLSSGYGVIDGAALTVQGAGSQWNAGSINLFNAALVVANGGSVNSGAYLAMGFLGSSSVSVNGTVGARGVLATGYLNKSGSNATLNLDGGILRATGNQSDFMRNFTVGNVHIQSGGAFIDTQAYNVSITTGGLLTGTGGLTKQGTGTLAVTGGNAYAGNTTVEAGTLQFDSYTQGSSQTLGLGASSISNYGKLVVNGTANFNAGANIAVDVAAMNNILGYQTLKNVITAANLNANGFIVTDNSALFNFNPIVNGNSVDLRVMASSGSGIYDAVNNLLHSSANGAARVLDNIINGNVTGDMTEVVNALGRLSSQGEVARATSQTIPIISGNQAVEGGLSTFQKLVQNRSNGNSNSSSENKGVSAGDAFANKNGWGKVFATRAEQDNRGGAAGFKADTWGLVLGADAEIAADARVGIAYGYAKTSVNGNAELSGSAQRANIGSHLLAAYGSKDIGDKRSFTYQADIGINNTDTTRQINFGGLNRTATGDYRTYTAHVGTALSQSIELSPATTLTPSLRADYTWLKSQRYTENGAAALNLNVAAQKTDAFVIGADAHLQHRFTPQSKLDANFGVGYDTINSNGNIVAAYAGAPAQSFVTTGITHSPWMLRGGIGYSHKTLTGTEVTVRYDAEGRSDYLNHTASVKANWAF